MMQHYELQPAVWHAQPLVFDWDIDAGEVSGPGAKQILDAVGDGHVSYQALWHKFSADPLKSKTDMAAILIFQHVLPDELVPFLPMMPDDGAPDVSYVDDDGVEVVGREKMVY